MDNIKTQIQQLSSELLAEVIKIRRHLHANPELSKQEFMTAKYIINILEENGIPYKTMVNNTAVVGYVRSENNSDRKIIALRSDHDALPIVEETTVEYKSTNKGVMHACGHDLHTASLLGTGIVLNKLKDKFEGTIELIFQPSEETYPGGAFEMIQEGFLENNPIDTIFAQHVLPELEAGKIGLKPGMYMASTDELYITVIGKGGHAAQPDKYINPLVIAAQILIKLDNDFKQLVPKDIPTVLAFGKIHSEGRTNIIPNEVKIDGTFRTFSEEWRRVAHQKINEIAKQTALAMGGDCVVDIHKGYPFLVNDDNVTRKTIVYAQQYLGSENVIDLPLRMTAEDFAYFAQNIPACYYRLGTGNKAKGITADLHTSRFDVDETAMETSVGLMCWIAINELSDKN